MADPLIDIKNLVVRFVTDEGVFKAVDDVSFHMNSGEIVGLVGESGCGKTVTAMSIPRLIPSPPGFIDQGEIRFKGRNLLAMPVNELRQIRGRAIGMIFQEPLSALSPLKRIGHQMVESLALHPEVPLPSKSGFSKNAARAYALEWIKKVNIPDAEERMHAYPFQLSGGMQQRIMIAMALMLGPDLVIADEPTTALDVTIQAQIFQLIRDMKAEQTAILLITHDLGVVWEMCDRVIVMYASRIVEQGSVRDIFESPAHPYTKGLLASIPRITETPGHLQSIPGQVPSPLQYPAGCHFKERCAHAMERCGYAKPPLFRIAAGHEAACFLVEKQFDPVRPEPVEGQSASIHRSHPSTSSG